MKRLEILFTLVCCLSYTLFSQSSEEREKNIITLNKVKSKIHWDYNYVKGKQSKQGQKVSISTYSNSGELLEENTLSSKEQIIGWEKYQYNNKGNRIMYERSDGNNKYSKVSQYDDNNNLILESGFNGAENFNNSFKYSSKGKLIEIIYSINGNMDEKRIYDNSGNISIISIFKAGRNLTSKLKLVYDNKGNVIEETMYSMDNKELEKKKLSYDNASRQIAEEKERGGNFIYKLTYEYNTKGDLISVSEENATVKKYVKKLYTYNVSNNLVEYKWRRTPTDEFNVKKYTYDSRGLCLTEHTFYPSTNFELLTKYEYEFY